MRSALEKVPGVQEVTVDYEKKQATVKTAEASLDTQKLLSALEATGSFQGKIKS